MTNIEFFRGISNYLWSQSDINGKLICKKHRIEHTGKNAYSIITDLYLYKKTGEEGYFERARQRALRVAGNLIVDPKHGQYMYWPGRLGKTNMSNSVIDSGGATDSLAQIILQYENKLTNEEQEKIKDAIFKNADTYLKEAVYKKELPDQRLWGAAGLASAYKIFSAEGGSATGGKAQEWKESLLKSIERTLSQEWADGTLPYHPNWKEYGLPSNMEETTTFYHSRQIGFILYILDAIDVGVGQYRSKLERAGEVLLAMYTPAGKKVLTLETKRWYWFGQYEVASYGFDLYALMRLHELTGDERYAATASHAFAVLTDHIQKDGGITSELEAEFDFQCRIFWNAHLAWLTRVVEKITDAPWYAPDMPMLSSFADNGVVKYENKNYSVLWRGQKKSFDTLYGPSMGGGSILYFGSAQNNWKNIIHTEEWDEQIPFNFLIKKNRLWSFSKFLRFVGEESTNLRALLYYWYIELRAGNWPGFRRRTADLWRKLFRAGFDVWNSAWATDAKVEISDSAVVFSLSPAKRNGEKLKSVIIERRYEPTKTSLLVQEKITITDPALRVQYFGLDGVRHFKNVGTFEYKYQLE